VENIISVENSALLKVIMQTQPESIFELAETTSRKPGNLSCTLKTMSSYGFVEIKRDKRRVRPVAKATEFRILRLNIHQI
jgi:predicted transcriptional regulator